MPNDLSDILLMRRRRRGVPVWLLRNPDDDSLPALDIDFVANRAYINDHATFPASILTVSRASAKYVPNSAGLLVPFGNNILPRTDIGLLPENQVTNQAIRSQEFNVSPWTTNNVIVTPDAILAPDGTLTADRVEIDTTAATTFSQSFASVTASTAYFTYEIYCKKGSGATDGNRFLIRNNTTATDLYGVTFNYDTGAVTASIGSGGNTVTPMADGWYRLRVSVSSGISNGDAVRIYAGWIGMPATAGTYVYFWGAGLKNAGEASSYIPTEGSAATRMADNISMPLSLLDDFDPTECTLVCEGTYDTDINYHGIQAWAACLGSGAPGAAVGLGIFRPGSDLRFGVSNTGDSVVSSPNTKMLGRRNGSSTHVFSNGSKGSDGSNVGAEPKTHLIIGQRGNNDRYWRSPLRRLTLFRGAISDAGCEALTS